MLIASKISMLEGLISEKELLKIRNLLLDYRFDLSLNYNYMDLKPFIFRDKKVQKGNLNLVLLKGMSKGIVSDKFDQKNLKKSIS